jgi:phenylacetyl-CoA:acceptor oxidoreductase subunit 2
MSYGPRPWQQAHWDWRAAANFMLGGTGAGLAVVAALALPAPRPALLAALCLVSLGLGAVWLEIGRKLRAAHVFFNPFTSWMTREAFAALPVFAFALIAAFVDSKAALVAAALAALAFVACQAQILRAAKGIPAWRAPEVVPLVVATGLAEGAGAALLFRSDAFVLALFGIAVIARALSWSRYRAVLRAQARTALEPAGKALLQVGTVVPLALALGATLLPDAAAPATLAAVAALFTGWRFKYVLVTRAAFNQGFALPQLPVRGCR